jgi:endonuclease/exonuclease/phosphatase family metal-dependent hydrolase
MPYYSGLRNSVTPKAARDKVIGKLVNLRDRLDSNVPAKDADHNLLLATWNIRDFDKVNRRGFGKRLPESFYYIAEIISRFDFVAVQEVNRLGEWERVMRILGPQWDYLATDVADTSIGGNGERLTYVWDKRKVWFQNIAGEIVLPAHMLISQVETEVDGNTIKAGKQFRRTPFVASFQSGWFKFDICTVHIYYGSKSGAKLDQRVEEIATIAEYLSERADVHMAADDRAMILLGDFNIVSPDHKTMKALLDNGFKVPESLRFETNVAETNHYDQIAFKTHRNLVEYTEVNSDDPTERNAGVFKLFGSTFKPSQVDDYKAAMDKTSNLNSADYGGDYDKYLHDWRTYQLSDHNVLWVRLKVNKSSDYLARMMDA